MSGPLDAEAMRRSVENLSYSGVVCYCAEIPGSRQGEQIDTLILSVDEERALFQMFSIAEEASTRWDANVSVAQRLGELMPGDSLLVIVAACAERDQAFDCCRFVADQMAERVPVRMD